MVTFVLIGLVCTFTLLMENDKHKNMLLIDCVLFVYSPMAVFGPNTMRNVV